MSLSPFAVGPKETIRISYEGRAGDVAALAREVGHQGLRECGYR